MAYYPDLTLHTPSGTRPWAWVSSERQQCHNTYSGLRATMSNAFNFGFNAFDLIFFLGTLFAVLAVAR